MLQDYFTDREPLLARLKGTAENPTLAATRIWHIQGRRGIGKTSLLKMLEAFCIDRGIPFHIAQCQPQFTELKILREIVEDLRRKGVALKTCLHRLKNLDEQERAEEQRRQQESAQVAGEMLRVGSGFLPVPAGAIGALAPSVLSLASLLHREDHRLRRDPVTELTSSFVNDLQRLPGRRVVLMLDDFDRLAHLDLWAAGWLQRVPSTVMVVLTGKRLPWMAPVRDVWPDCDTATRNETLQAFTERDSYDFIRRYYRKEMKVPEPDKEEMASIRRGGHDLPFALRAVCYARAKGLVGAGDVPASELRETAEWLRSCMPAELQALFDAAAVLRFFDRRAVTAVAGSEQTARGFDDLLELPFVDEVAPGAWTVHDFARGIVTADVARHDPDRYAALQGRAFEYYRAAIRAEDPARSFGPSRDRLQKFQLELIYHGFRISPERGIPEMCQAFDEAYYVRRDFAFCQALVNELNAQRLEASVGQWLEFYRALLAPAEQSADALNRVLVMSGLERPVRIQALQALGGTYALEDRREQARKLFDRALLECERRPVDTAGRIKCYLWLSHIAKREGTADKYLLMAAGLCENIPEGTLLKGLLDRELADVYRLEGRFKEAGKHALNAINALRAQGFSFELAHSLRVLGMLRVYTGGLDEAESLFKESLQLFEKMDPGKKRRYEWVWLWMGLGDVALGKGEFAKARELYHDAEQKAQNSEFEVAVIRGCQADLFAAQGDWDRAIELAQGSREVRKNHQDWFGVALTLDTEGRALCGKGLYAQATERLREGAKLAADCHLAYLESRLTLSLARSQTQAGTTGFEDALSHAQELATRNEYSDHLACIQFLLGEEELRQKNFAASVRCFDAALEFARKFNSWFADSILNDIVAASSGTTAREFTKYAESQSRRQITPAGQAGGD